MTMPFEYFTTRFTMREAASFPDEFAIITGYATTGESWPEERSRKNNVALLARLESRGVWIHPITGHSPDMAHMEPGWAAELRFDDACDLGRDFEQMAIYYVRGDALFVSWCDERRSLVPVGAFRERVTVGGR